METKNIKKQPNVDQSKKLTDRTWDQAKRKEISWKPAKIKECARKMITKYTDI